MTSEPATEPPAPGVRCAICDGVEADARLIATCYDCGQPFHLNPYSDREGIDCGDAVLGENLGLYLLCNPCLGEHEAAAAPPPGVDPARARAEAMIAALHGDALGFPAAPAPRPALPPPAGSRPRRPRRRYRRIDR